MSNNIILGSIDGYVLENNLKFTKLKLNNKLLLPDFRVENIFMHLGEIFQFFFGGHFSIKKDLFLKYKFDEKFIGWGEEDLELGYRLLKGNECIKFSEKAVIFPIENGNNEIFLNLKKIKTSAYNSLYFYKKYINDLYLKNWLFNKFNAEELQKYKTFKKEILNYQQTFENNLDVNFKERNKYLKNKRKKLKLEIKEFLLINQKNNSTTDNFFHKVIDDHNHEQYEQTRKKIFSEIKNKKDVKILEYFGIGDDVIFFEKNGIKIYIL
ncbi:MAG: galactosyltransferase-related protein [Candidatus Gracilibacteria bacterium]|nr:galactosyltransferase-related protein [Candidatus Gracilibacteria bacterium]